MYDIIHTLHEITVTLYDIIPQYLWHHSHCIHDIRSPTYDITSRVYDISSPIPVTSQTLLVNTYQQYLSSNTRCIDNTTTISEITKSICVSVWSYTVYPDITHTVLMTWHLLYLWHNMQCIWHLTHDFWHYNTLSITSVYYISYQTDYIWQHIHSISVITPRLSII